MRTTLVCLHGWGGSKESFTELTKALQGRSDLRMLTPELPGFGAEPEPKEPWTVDDYADWVDAYLRRTCPASADTRLFVLGHSHGGRIAIVLAARQSMSKTSGPAIERLYLCAPAGIRHARHFRRIIGLTLAKSGKALLSLPGLSAMRPIAQRFLYKLVRVHDYERASPIMRETLRHVSAQDLRPMLPTIALPCDIFWGTDDRMTPISDSRIMAHAIPQAILHVFPGVRHAVHRDRAGDIARCIVQALDASPTPS